MLRPQPADDLVALRATERVLCQRAGNDLECLRPPLHCVLSETLEPIPVHLHTLREFKLRCASTRDETRILDQGLDDIHAIVDRALEVVQPVLRRTAEDDRRRARLLRAVGRVVVRVALDDLPQDGDAVAADLDALKDVDEASLFGGGRAHAREWGRVHDAAEAAEVELGEHFEDGDVHPVEIVQRELAYA